MYAIHDGHNSSSWRGDHGREEQLPQGLKHVGGDSAVVQLRLSVSDPQAERNNASI